MRKLKRNKRFLQGLRVGGLFKDIALVVCVNCVMGAIKRQSLVNCVLREKESSRKHVLYGLLPLLIHALTISFQLFLNISKIPF